MVKVTISADGIGNAILSRIPQAEEKLRRAVIDSCEPFVPYRTGELCRSVISEGTGNDGRIVYTARHAALCYYASRPFSKNVHPTACAHWFEAAKSSDMGQWLTVVSSAISDTSGGGRIGGK